MKKLLATILALVMTLTLVPAAWATGSEKTINVTPDNVQDVLDGVYGNINDTTIVLTAGDYGTLYLRQSLKKVANTETTASIRNKGLETSTTGWDKAYYRAFENVTIKAANGATVTCDGIMAEAGYYATQSNSASNQAEMDKEISANTGSGFVSFLLLKNVTIEGITFDKTDASAIYLWNIPSSGKFKGATLLVDGLTIKNCKGTGNAENKDVHFLRTADSCEGAFCNNETKYPSKDYNDIRIVGCEMIAYYQPICWNNATVNLTNFTVTENTFKNCKSNNIQISNKANCGTFTFTGNTIIGQNGRFIRLANVQANAVIMLAENKIVNPVGFNAGLLSGSKEVKDSSGKAGKEIAEIVKISGTGFKVEKNENNDWTVYEATSSKWIAVGDVTKNDDDTTTVSKTETTGNTTKKTDVTKNADGEVTKTVVTETTTIKDETSGITTEVAKQTTTENGTSSVTETTTTSKTVNNKTVSAVVEIKGNAAKEVVGVYDAAMADAPKTGDDAGKNFKLKLTVEKAKEESANATEMITNKANDKETLEFKDIDLTKYVYTNAETETTGTAVNKTSKVLAVTVPFETEGKENITVYRAHDGEVTSFTKLSKEPTEAVDGTFLVGDGQLTIYTDKFSTYAIGYTVPTPVTRSTNRPYIVVDAATAAKAAETTTATTVKKTASANTFDAGVGVYAATAILSVTGMAWVGKKKH